MSNDHHRLNRRDFVRAAGVAAAAAACRSALAADKAVAPAKAPAEVTAPSAKKLGWEMACQLYTFRSISCYEAMGRIASLGVRLLEPCFFLRLDKARPNLKTGPSLGPKIRKEWKARLDDRGMRMVNFYARLTGNADDCRKQFEFAREMGVETFVSEPKPGEFDTIEKFCDEYKINLAVHNHPKKRGYDYWKPENVLKLFKGRSKRIGACCDTGHWVRSGLDVVECIKTMTGRIITMHLKDVAEVGNPRARDVPLGRGKARYADVLKQLAAQKYRGVMSIEYEHQSPALLADVAECIAFVEKTAKAIQTR